MKMKAAITHRPSTPGLPALAAIRATKVPSEMAKTTPIASPRRSVVRRLPSRSENARAKGERRETVGPIVATGGR